MAFTESTDPLPTCASSRDSILLAPNEDGLGPSAFLIRLIPTLLRRQGLFIIILVASDRLQRFHEAVVEHNNATSRITVVKLRLKNDLKLVKRTDGGVDIARSIDQFLLPYNEAADAYKDALAAEGILNRVHTAVDIGVPALCRAIHAHNRASTEVDGIIHMITWFDHSWSLTLQMISDSAESGSPSAVQTALSAMRADEVKTDLLLLFSAPIAPPIFRDKWIELRQNHSARFEVSAYQCCHEHVVHNMADPGSHRINGFSLGSRDARRHWRPACYSLSCKSYIRDRA
jgi:hypothetical protein